MGKHRQVLQQVVETLQRYNPKCSVLLTGSVMRGTQRPESDIDLFAVVPDVSRFKASFGGVVHSTAQVKVVEACVDAVTVTITCCDSHLLHEIVREPWRNYLFAKAEILCDPLGVVRQSQQTMNEWFAAHPDVEALWTEQQHKHARCKASVRQGQKASLRFPSWDAFADHVDRFVRQRRDS